DSRQMPRRSPGTAACPLPGIRQPDAVHPANRMARPLLIRLAVMLAYVAQPDASSTTLRCRHCGDPCDRPVRDGDNVFCCIGCRSVYPLLMQEGLDGYSACEVPPGVPQRDAELREPDRFAALDDPATAAAFLEFDD